MPCPSTSRKKADEFTPVNVIRHKKLGFTGDRKLLLTLVTFCHHQNFGWMLLLVRQTSTLARKVQRFLNEGLSGWDGAEDG